MPRSVHTHLTRLRSYFRLALTGWTVVLAGLLAWSLTVAHNTTFELARKEAFANFNKDQAFRFWAAGHGGVYVPVTAQTPRNPRLSHIPERDITTPSGRELTLMNPAYMVRQLNEEYADLFGVRGHITSEKLMRPENAPDPWERKALAAFGRGEKEMMEVAEIEGQPFLRFMRPMFIKQGCLKCHAFQGYKSGELRGGVSVAVPLAPYLEQERRFVATTVFSYLAVWGLGLYGIRFGWQRLRRDHEEIERAGAEIQALNRGLERRVKERTAELDAANQELEAFAYSVSHDLRAPLRSISGFSTAVLEDYADRLDDNGRDYLERIDRNTAKLGVLIDDILSLSRLTRGEMHFQPVDLSATVTEILSALAAEAPEREVETRISPGVVAHGDPRLLRVILDNLLRNAWKFTSRASRPRIEFSVERRGDQPVYSVRDNGAGFDMSYADNLFAPFKRMHSAEEFPGSGIGLATVQRAVRRHGGRVWAESVPGEGAVFHFTLAEAPGPVQGAGEFVSAEPEQGDM